MDIEEFKSKLSPTELEQFIENYKPTGNMPKTWQDYVLSRSEFERVILGFAKWDDTPQGGDYWQDIFER